jgi:hypothetical protein
MLHIAARRPEGRGWRDEAHRRGLDLCNIYLTTIIYHRLGRFQSYVTVCDTVLSHWYAVGSLSRTRSTVKLNCPVLKHALQEELTMDPQATTDKRVLFDFAVEFSNGGGIQGQGFRLDIEGDLIDDAALAGYIVRDMRLLMVKQVQILKQQIITERHQRATPPRRLLIDVSHAVADGMITITTLRRGSPPALAVGGNAML